jgi:molecular chaperone DnaJ
MNLQEAHSILGTTPSDSPEDIKKKYRNLARENHPDKNPSDVEGATERLKKINVAYDVISNPDKHQSNNQNPFVNMKDAFGDMFSEFVKSKFNNNKQPQKVKIPNIVNGSIPLTLKEVLNGKKDIEVPIVQLKHCATCEGFAFDKSKKIEKCANCKGNGHFQVQEGMFMNCPQCNGQGMIRIGCKSCSGSGVYQSNSTTKINVEPGTYPGTQKINEHIINIEYKMPQNVQISEEGDVGCILELSYPEMMLGGSKKIILPVDEEEVKIKVPELVKQDQMIRLQEKGLPFRNGKRGMLFLVCKLQPTPTKKLSDNVKKILQDLKKEMETETNNE